MRRLSEVKEEMRVCKAQIPDVGEFYYEHAARLAAILQDHAPDTLAEAKAMLREQMEADELRQRQEEREEAARLAEEVHRRQMESYARAQAEAAREAAWAQTYQAEMAASQAREAQKLAAKRCGQCANNSKCSFGIKCKDPNCAGFRPR